MMDGAGLCDPVSDAQQIFRAVMLALARPGRLEHLAVLPNAPPGLPAGVAAIALTLADYETPIWLDDRLAANEAVISYLTFQTGAAITDDPAAAGFALVANAQELPRLDQFAQGSLEYPDRSTTVIAAVESFTGASELVLCGPGIDGTASIAPRPLPQDFCQRLVLNLAQFPCGVDLILVAGNDVVGLPRSVRIEG